MLENEPKETNNTEELNNNQHSVNKENLTIGEMLKQARLAKGIDFNQIYEATKIRKAYVESLENNDFKSLPNMLVARGYMKLYAEYLNLDVNYFIDRFNNLFPEEATGSNGPRNPKENNTKFDIFIPKQMLVPTALRSMNSGGSIQFSSDPRLKVNKKLVYNISLTVGLVLFAIILSNLYFQNTIGAIKSNPRLQSEVQPLEAKITPEALAQQKIFNKVTILARALKRTYITVVMDGRLVFRGNMDAGNTKYWEADQYIRIKTAIPRNLELAINGEAPVKMADQINMLEQTYYPLKEGQTTTLVTSSNEIQTLQPEQPQEAEQKVPEKSSSEENLFTF